jgi:hypothetical protein
VSAGGGGSSYAVHGAAILANTKGSHTSMKSRLYVSVKSCPAGLITDGLTCRCPAGLVTDGLTCRCPAGKYAADAGSSACFYCPSGKFSDADGATACTVSGIGQFVSTYLPLPSPTRCIRVDNVQLTDSGGCRIINLAELTLWNSGVALSMLGAPVVMSSILSGTSYGPSLLVDGVLNNFIHTANSDSCDPNPWVYIDIGTRHFDRVVVTNRIDSCCRDWINGARISFVSDVDGEMPYSPRHYIPYTAAVTFTFEFPEGSGSLGGSAVSNCPDGYSTFGSSSTSVAACNVCNAGFAGDGTTCTACMQRGKICS